MDATPTNVPISDSESGFTLVELLSVLTVTGVLAVIAVPGLAGFLGRQQLSSAAHTLYGDLKLARSEAVTRFRRVHICKSRDGATCAAEADWSDGWIVFQDLNENRSRDADDALIRTRPASPDNVHVRFGSLDPAGIAFKPNGDGSFNGTFTFCLRNNSATSRAIAFHASGRPRFIDQSTGGGALRCN